MSTLTIEIQEAIRKSLPEQTAYELKAYLTKAENDAKQVETLAAKVKLLEEENKRHSEKLIKAGNIDARENAVAVKERELDSRLVKITHTEEVLKLRQEQATDVKLTAMEMMKIVFKSQPTGYAFNINKSENGQQACGGGNYGTVPVAKTSSEYVTQKEITE